MTETPFGESPWLKEKGNYAILPAMTIQSSQWKTILPLFFILLVDAMSYGIVMPELGPMLLDKNSTMLPSNTPLEARNILYTMTLGLPMLFMLFGAPLLGDISDHIGRKKALFMAMLGVSFSCLFSAYGVIIGSVLILIIGRCILGFMDGSESIAKAAIADISSAKHKVLNMSLMSLSGTVGFVFGPLVGGFLSDHTLSSWFNYETPFLVAALLAFLNALGLFFLFKETFIPKKKSDFHILKSFHHIITAFTDKKIRRLSIIFFCMQFAWGCYFQSVSILLVESYHYNTQQIGLFLTYLAFCFIIALTIIIRILVRYFDNNTIVALGLFFIFAGGTLLTFSHQENTAWISVMPISIGIGMSYNTVLGLFSNAVDKDKQGRIMGVATALFASAWILASVCSGLLSSVNVYLPYVTVSLAALGGLVTLLLYKNPQQSSCNNTQHTQ